MVYMKTVRFRTGTSCAKVVGSVAILLHTLNEGKKSLECMLTSESCSLLQRVSGHGLQGEPWKPELLTEERTLTLSCT